MSKLIKTDTYTILVKDIAELYNRARKTLVDSYWHIGRRIVEQEQQGDGKAEYGVQLLEHLSEDLQQKLGSGFSIRNLRNMRRFYLNHRIRQPAAELNWSQHVELLPVTNQADKRSLEQRIIRNKLSRRQIRQEVRWIEKKRDCYCGLRIQYYDKYARYLADVFYLPDSTNPKAIYAQGIYLNQ